MAEIVKYKFFYSSEEFEDWQKTTEPMRIHSCTPVPMAQNTTGTHNQMNGAVNLTNTPDYCVFVTYVDYSFPGEADAE